MERLHFLDDFATPAAFPSETPLDWTAVRNSAARVKRLSCPLTIHAFRHGQTSLNLEGRITGTRDVPLTKQGRRQARWLGAKLSKHYDAAFCSTLARSRESLRIGLRASHGSLTHGVFADTRLAERSLGTLEGTPARHIDAYRRGDLDYAPEGGDSYSVVALRMLSFLNDLVAWAEEAKAKTFVMSTHMGPLRMLVGICRNDSDPAIVLARKFDNTEVLELCVTELRVPDFVEAPSFSLGQPDRAEIAG